MHSIIVLGNYIQNNHLFKNTPTCFLVTKTVDATFPGYILKLSKNATKMCLHCTLLPGLLTKKNTFKFQRNIPVVQFLYPILSDTSNLVCLKTVASYKKPPHFTSCFFTELKEQQRWLYLLHSSREDNLKIQSIFIGRIGRSVTWLDQCSFQKFLRNVASMRSRICRSSHSQLFFKVGVLKNFANFTGKRLC